MSEEVATPYQEQIDAAIKVLKGHIPDLLAIHLYGSAIDGGLKPSSDIDLLVTLQRSLEEDTRKNLLRDLLTVSAPPKTNNNLRALEITAIVYEEIRPWRYPPKRELQFGEWLRNDLQKGIFDLPTLDHDLAILLTKVRQNSIALWGPEAVTMFDPVPQKDFFQAMNKTLTLWNTPEDWKGDERNVVLTLARIWFSAATGNIASKDEAATWVLQRLPPEHQNILKSAQADYLGKEKENLTSQEQELKAFINFAKKSAESLLEK